jgi:hypothetical protein
MGGYSKLLAFLLICGSCAPTALCQTKPADTDTDPTLTSSQLLEQRLSPDAGVRAAAKKHNLSYRISKDLNGQDPAVQSAAVEVVKKLLSQELRDPAGQLIVDKPAGWCRSSFDNFSKALLALKQYDVIEIIAAKSVSDGQMSAEGDRALATVAKMLLAAGKYDQALLAAKTYYDYCALDKTADAIDLLCQALANGPAEHDTTIIRRFKMQQAAGAQLPSSDGSAAGSPSNPSENVLKSIPIDPKPYQAELDKLAAGPKNFETLTARGNLLLLCDRGAEAKDLFEMALDLTADQKHLSSGIANVARAIRARDGSVGAANAYLLSLRDQNKPAEAAQAPK